VAAAAAAGGAPHPEGQPQTLTTRRILLTGKERPHPPRPAPHAATPSADDAARAKCKSDFWVGDVTFPEGPGWMDEARKHIAATTPPKRT
jgi:hypothetical protein